MPLPTLAMYLTLVLCALVLGAAASRYDLYEREPWYAMLLGIFIGIAAMYGAYWTEVGALRLVHGLGGTVTDNAFALMVGIVEECAKFAGVLVIFLLVRKAFTEPLDGIVYGSFVGLGAAVQESFALLMNMEHNTLPPQEPVRLIGHLVMGGIGCAGLGILTMTKESRPRFATLFIPGTLLAAIALHTAWDMIAFAQEEPFSLRTIEGYIPLALMLGGMITYRWLVAVFARLTRRHLQVCDIATRDCG